MEAEATPKDPWPEPDPVVRSDEATGVYLHRYNTARQAGLSFVEAQLFADGDQDLAVLRKLARDGCDPVLIARIVL